MKLTIPTPNLNHKFTTFDVYLRLLLLLPLTTLLQNKIGFINVALFFVIFMFQGIIILQRVNLRTIIFIALAIISFTLTALNTKNLNFDNYLAYYINWLLFSTVISQNYDKFIDWIKNNEFYLKMVMFIWSALVAFSILLPSSYYLKEGSGRYFCSYTKDIFRLAPTALFIQCLALISIVLFNNRKDIIYMLLPLFCGFMGSSRTYFIIIVVVFVLGLFFFSSTKLRFAAMAAPTGLLGIIAYAKSSISEKVRYTLDDSQWGDLLFRISSGRSELWERIWVRYVKFTPFRKTFGAGFRYTNRVNHGLYAHNDFIEILATHGIFGIILYLLCVYLLFRTFFKNKHIPIVMIGACFFVWFFNANFNMFYWYTCAAISFPFLLAVVRCYYDNKDNQLKTNSY